MGLSTHIHAFFGGFSSHPSTRDMFQCRHDVSRSRPELWSRVSRTYHMPDSCRRDLYGVAVLEESTSGNPTRLPRNGLNAVSARLELRSRSNRHGHTLEMACERGVDVTIDASGQPTMSCCKTAVMRLCGKASEWHPGSHIANGGV